MTIMKTNTTVYYQIVNASQISCCATQYVVVYSEKSNKLKDHGHIFTNVMDILNNNGLSGLQECIHEMSCSEEQFIQLLRKVGYNPVKTDFHLPFIDE